MLWTHDAALEPLGELGEDVVAADVEDEADAGAAEGVEGLLVGEVDAHAVDAPGPVELHHVAPRREVVAQDAVADADGFHGCKLLISCCNKLIDDGNTARGYIEYDECSIGLYLAKHERNEVLTAE